MQKHSSFRRLADFNVDGKRLALVTALAVVVGIVGALLAKLLLWLIGEMTHLAYFGRFGATLIQPDPRHWGPIAVAIPVLGALLVGLIARYGSEKIRGHGIPEAIQSILEGNSVIQARVAFFKPLASAIAIGTGAPFGAEGPIIMTGGAFGSLFAQYLRLSAIERRTLLVAGAAAGMSATFGAPIASVFIAVELLLFEWRPRSFIPVVVASFVADALRSAIISTQPPFISTISHAHGPSLFGWALLVGLCGGVVSMVMTKLVYLAEDAYERLPIHWMWWPAIGGLFVGLGGSLVPAALGVGYPTIGALVNGELAVGAAVGIIVVKILIWILSLSSGTSGGVLAPLLMIGAAMGTIAAQVIPGHDAGLWAIVGMAALMGGTMRAPFMGTLFALETTHAWNLSPEIFLGCVAATAFTVVFVPRSILTEKLARRGTHVAREYAVDSLESLSVEAIVRPIEREGEPPRASISIDSRIRTAADLLASSGERTLAVIDREGRWVGTVGSEEIVRAFSLSLQADRPERVRKTGVARLFSPGRHSLSVRSRGGGERP
ncbi:MAG: chloride channel protein [Candidatus Baltobacteraceae bacterium]